MFVCTTCLQSALARILKRRRIVYGGSDKARRVGCDLPVSRLNTGAACVSKLNLWQQFDCERDSVAHALTRSAELVGQVVI